MTSVTRRSFVAKVGAGFAAGTLVRGACAAETQTPDQMLNELIQENQDSGLGSGFDNTSRNVKLPKKSLPNSVAFDRGNHADLDCAIRDNRRQGWLAGSAGT